MQPIPVKILGTKRHQRYIIWRTLQAACMTLGKEFPDLTLDIQKVSSMVEIQRYTPVVAFPSLMIAEKLVCVGRYPKRDEVLEWLKMTIT
jgi:hypothetical protein